MKTIEIIVNEDILKEAEKVFHSIGMDVQMGVNIFLRRVAMEKGLPMSMSAPATGSNEKDNSFKSQDLLSEEPIPRSRTTSKITQEMVDDVWQAFLKYHKGLGETGSLIDEASENSGMNRGSASIYMYALINLVKGEPNTRIIKINDLDYLLEKIKTDLGKDELLNALQSLRDSIPYWRETIQGFYADKVERLCSKYDYN